MSEVKQKAALAKNQTTVLSTLTSEQKNEALLLMADVLLDQTESIIDANRRDLENGEQNGLGRSLLDRLALNSQRIEAMAEGLRQIAELPDPIGDLLEQFERPNGLDIKKIRVPIGVIGMIYEARPNVTVDAAGLALKTGNAIVLRGGSSALLSNRRIVEVLRQGLEKSAVPVQSLQLIDNPDRSSVNELLKANGLLDVIIPRGGRSLIQNVIQNATVPAIETGAGICHTYLHADADPEMGNRIAVNAKVQRPSVCNAMETLLLHRTYAERHLSELILQFDKAGVTLKGCAVTRQMAPALPEATENDFQTEYNDYILNIKTVETLDEAMEHIRRYGTMHSECIVTRNEQIAQRFLNEVDAAAVYHNASTRFTDGFEFGFGAEIGISTQKLHARGPMGLPALTSTKYIISGKGQIRE